MSHLNQIEFELLKSTFIPISGVKAKNTKESGICVLVAFCIFNSVSYQSQRISILASTIKTEGILPVQLKL